MIVVIGDNHLSDSRPWSVEASDAQIDLIINHPLNTPENVAIFTGDLVDQPFMSGRVYHMLLRLFSGLKFKEVYVLQGNHDIKMDKLKNPTLAYRFLLDKHILKGVFSHIHPITEVSQLTIEGMEVLLLPFVYTTSKGSIKDYENLPESIVEKEYDLCITHVADTSLSSYPGTLIDLSKVKAKYWASGHVHTPSSHYVGSVMPNSLAESGEKRQFRTYSKDKGENIVDIDEILGYYTVEFPNDIPSNLTAKIKVFTITSCTDEYVAKQRYGNIHVRKVVNKVSLDKDSGASNFSFSGEEELNTEKLYQEWRKDSTKEPSLLEKADKYFHSFVSMIPSQVS